MYCIRNCIRVISLASLALAALLAAGAAHAQGITSIMRDASTVHKLPPAPAAAAAAASTKKQRLAEYIVALVNSEPITNTEVNTKVERALQNGGPEIRNAPRAELARAALERIISEKAQLQLAKEQGIKVDQLTVNQAAQSVANQNQISVEEMYRRLAADGIGREAFHEELRQQLTLQRLREREVEPRVQVSDLEVDQYLRKEGRRAGRSNAPEIEIAHVLVSVPESATAEQRAELEKRAQDIAARARDGEDFAALARELSDASDRSEGGAMGVRSADRYPQLFTEAVNSIQVGEIAGPVRVGNGFHILKLLSRQAPSSSVAVTQTHVRHILLRPDAKLSAEQAVAKLNGFKKRVQAGTADFAGLARDNSQDASAQAGGDLGWSRPGMFVPEFEEAMDRLSPGQLSDPVMSRFGVHLIQVLERREAKLSPAEQREAARAALREKRLDEAYETWAQEVRARAFVEYREAPQP